MPGRRKGVNADAVRANFEAHVSIPMPNYFSPYRLPLHPRPRTLGIPPPVLLRLRQSGVLEVNPSELRLTPPSTEDINRWCAYADLREATEPRVNVARAPQGSRDGGVSIGCTTEATRCVFLRVRVKPSGPWGFTRTFQANWPRPMKWAMDCSNAGGWFRVSSARVICLFFRAHGLCRTCFCVGSGLNRGPKPSTLGFKDQSSTN